jgi:hypothetical protein
MMWEGPTVFGMLLTDTTSTETQAKSSAATPQRDPAVFGWRGGYRRDRDEVQEEVANSVPAE